MIKDDKTALKEQIDLNKGILLSGPIGCGKTSIMHLIKPFANPLSDYKIKTCRELSFEFAKSGFDAINVIKLLDDNEVVDDFEGLFQSFNVFLNMSMFDLKKNN